MKPNHEIHFEETLFDESIYQESEYLEVPTSRKAFLLVAILSCLSGLLILGRVGMLGFFKGEDYLARASANLSREINLTAPRAAILDRFGKPLAVNNPSFSLLINAGAVMNDGEKSEAILSEAAAILKVEANELAHVLESASQANANWLVLARGLNQSEAIAFKGLNRDIFQVIDDFEREYPEGEVFAHLLGYTGAGESNEIIGKAGIELEYDGLIRGEDGRFVFYEDALGKALDQKVIKGPSSSPPLETAIDAEFTVYFHRRLQEGLRALGRTSGAGIALNPQTGEILALVSSPSFDSNVFVKRGLSRERMLVLNDEREPLFNRAVSGVYSPGSTIKPLVALSALKEGVLNPKTEIFSAGSLAIPNPYYPDKPSIFLDWKPHGWVDLHAALARSSNIYFYLTAGGLPRSLTSQGLTRGDFNFSGLGIKKLRNYWKLLGFGAPTGLDLPFESGGFLPDVEEKELRTGQPWRLGDTYNVAIGQGDLQITPIQLISFIASLGNGGKIYRPFVKYGTAPEILIDYSDWGEIIREVQIGLEEAVSAPYGSAHLLSDLPIKVAGKTGTPQIANNLKTNALFIGYAPAEDPEIAILVLIENAREGSLNALPIAKDVFRWYYENRLNKSEILNPKSETNPNDRNSKFETF